MDNVAVAVVVATYNRATLLPRLMAALAAQRDVGQFEVIVVDDASPDGTSETLDRLASDVPFKLVVMRQPSNRGPAAARNRGWRAAEAPFVCFTDDDCVPEPGWLSAMVGALQTADLAQGCTLPNPEQSANWGPFSHTLDVRSETGHYETANMGYRRSVLERLDGFDEAFHFPYGEDADLAWRAKESGATSSFVEDAVVHHDITPSDWWTSLRARRRMEGMVQLLQRHPDIRRRNGWGQVFCHPQHARAAAVALAGAGLAASPRSPTRWAAAAGTGLWYAWDCGTTRAKPKVGRIGWLAAVPGALLIDLAGVAVLARASVRYRTLLL